jgi:hypothetical protein
LPSKSLTQSDNNKTHILPSKSNTFISLFGLTFFRKKGSQHDKTGDNWDVAIEKISSLFCLFGSICLQIYFFFFETFVSLFLRKICICEIGILCYCSLFIYEFQIWVSYSFCIFLDLSIIFLFFGLTLKENHLQKNLF